MKENPQSDALRWLLEMEAIADPNVLNSLVLNIFRLSGAIKDVEFVADVDRRKLLVYVELSWFALKFKQRKMHEAITNLLEDILPSFQKRVVFERIILDKALELLKRQESNVEKNQNRTAERRADHKSP